VVCKKKAAEKKEKESKKVAVQVDELLTFRHFSKKAALEVDDVRHFTN
jgi:coatomer subunit beta